jgi:outer membrane protein assembly factor BamE (lipoprotein component of BamABCDE complex)
MKGEKVMKKYIGMLLVILLAFVFGCAPKVLEGRKIDAAKVKQMVTGETTADQVTKLFGEPLTREKFPSGEEYFLYKYKTADPAWYTIDKVFNQKLDINLKEGVVEKYKFREEGQEVVLK